MSSRDACATSVALWESSASGGDGDSRGCIHVAKHDVYYLYSGIIDTWKIDKASFVKNLGE